MIEAPGDSELHASSDLAKGALSDVTVLDFSLQLPGPYATWLLRSMGADVVAVEPPNGDPARVLDPQMFSILSQGKRRLWMDLKHPQSRQVSHSLIARADVVIEGFRPGVADRLGIGKVEARTSAPNVIYVSLSGYGSTGPLAQSPGHDINYLGLSSPIAVDESSQEIGIPMVDLAAGTMAALSVVSALRARSLDRPPETWQELDVALFDSAVAWSLLKNQPDRRSSARTAGPNAEPAYGVYRTSDGEYISIAALEDQFFERLCDACNWRDWLEDGRFATYRTRRQAGQEINERLKSTLAKRPTAEWLRLFEAHDIPAAPVVRSVREVTDHPQLKARGILAEESAGVLSLRPPLPLALIRDPEDRPDEVAETVQILAAAGIDEIRARELINQGAVGSFDLI